MATTATATGNKIVLYDVSWETYERLLSDMSDRSSPRLTYDRGSLEIRSPTEDLVGITVGLGGALATGWLLKGLLFGVAPNDLVTLTLVPLLLATLTILATRLLTRRASRIDPALVLRREK